jgi:hypothetical protein
MITMVFKKLYWAKALDILGRLGPRPEDRGNSSHEGKLLKARFMGRTKKLKSRYFEPVPFPFQL